MVLHLSVVVACVVVAFVAQIEGIDFRSIIIGGVLVHWIQLHLILCLIIVEVNIYPIWVQGRQLGSYVAVETVIDGVHHLLRHLQAVLHYGVVQHDIALHLDYRQVSIFYLLFQLNLVAVLQEVVLTVVP